MHFKSARLDLFLKQEYLIGAVVCLQSILYNCKYLCKLQIHERTTEATKLAEQTLCCCCSVTSRSQSSLVYLGKDKRAIIPARKTTSAKVSRVRSSEASLFSFMISSTAALSLFRHFRLHVHLLVQILQVSKSLGQAIAFKKFQYVDIRNAHVRKQFLVTFVPTLYVDILRRICTLIPWSISLSLVCI